MQGGAAARAGWRVAQPLGRHLRNTCKTKFKRDFADEISRPIYQQVEELITNLLVGRSARNVRIFFVSVTVMCGGATLCLGAPPGPGSAPTVLRRSADPRSQRGRPASSVTSSSVVRVPGLYPGYPGSSPGGAVGTKGVFIGRWGRNRAPRGACRVV